MATLPPEFSVGDTVVVAQDDLYNSIWLNRTVTIIEVDEHDDYLTYRVRDDVRDGFTNRSKWVVNVRAVEGSEDRVATFSIEDCREGDILEMRTPFYFDTPEAPYNESSLSSAGITRVLVRETPTSRSRALRIQDPNNNTHRGMTLPQYVVRKVNTTTEEESTVTTATRTTTTLNPNGLRVDDHVTYNGTRSDWRGQSGTIVSAGDEYAQVRADADPTQTVRVALRNLSLVHVPGEAPAHVDTEPPALAVGEQVILTTDDALLRQAFLDGIVKAGQRATVTAVNVTRYGRGSAVHQDAIELEFTDGNTCWALPNMVTKVETSVREIQVGDTVRVKDDADLEAVLIRPGRRGQAGVVSSISPATEHSRCEDYVYVDNLPESRAPLYFYRRHLEVITPAERPGPEVSAPSGPIQRGERVRVTSMGGYPEAAVGSYGTLEQDYEESGYMMNLIRLEDDLLDIRSAGDTLWVTGIERAPLAESAPTPSLLSGPSEWQVGDRVRFRDISFTRRDLRGKEGVITAVQETGVQFTVRTEGDPQPYGEADGWRGVRDDQLEFVSRPGVEPAAPATPRELKVGDRVVITEIAEDTERNPYIGIEGELVAINHDHTEWGGDDEISAPYRVRFTSPSTDYPIEWYCVSVRHANEAPADTTSEPVKPNVGDIVKVLSMPAFPTDIVGGKGIYLGECHEEYQAVGWKHKVHLTEAPEGARPARLAETYSVGEVEVVEVNDAAAARAELDQFKRDAVKHARQAAKDNGMCQVVDRVLIDKLNLKAYYPKKHKVEITLTLTGDEADKFMAAEGTTNRTRALNWIRGASDSTIRSTSNIKKEELEIGSLAYGGRDYE